MNMESDIEQENQIKQDLDGQLFGVRRSIRYHHRRRRFFEHLHKFSTALSALSGSATIVSILAQALPAFSITFAAIVAISSALDLVFGFSTSARLHADLARRFIELEKSFVKNDLLTKEVLADFGTRRLEIEADEPPPSIVLNSICHNELLRAMGCEESEFLKISLFQRLCCQFFDWKEYNIGPQKKNSCVTSKLSRNS